MVSPAESAGFGGGEISPPTHTHLLNSRVNGSTEVCKAATESPQQVFLRKVKEPKKITSQVKVRSNVKIVTFQLKEYQDGTNKRCEPKLCHKASQRMKKVAYKYGPYTK